jgi:hypothetical protein
MPALVAALVAAAAAWVSLGTIAIDAAGARTAAVPVDAWHLAAVALAGILVGAAAWRGAWRRALCLVAPLLVLFLPWLPWRVPASWLLWTGPLAAWPWVGTAAVALAANGRSLSSPLRALEPGRQRWLAGALALAWFAAAAWGSAAARPGGDEPHYLVITQSLLYDGDLQIDNNHRRGDYHAYYPGDLRPDVLRPGRNGALYSVHAPGLPAIVLPAFAMAGYRGVVLFLLVCAAAAAALAWWLAFRTTGDAGAAWFGWAAVVFAAPYVFESGAVYPDGFGAAVVLTGCWALLRVDWDAPSDARWWPWLLHGAALASLPWLHTRFAVLAAALGGLILVRLARAAHPVPKAIAFLSIPAVSALAWLFFFVVLYGTPDPSAPYGRTDNSFAYLANGLGGLLLDQGFGLLATAPVLGVAFAGLARVRRFALEWLVVAVPYVLAVATYPMWWAGSSAPARFLVPIVLPLAIPAACGWAAIRDRGGRAGALALLIVTVTLTAVMAFAGGGQLGYHERNTGGMTAAPWADWASPLVDLPAALPAFVPLPVGNAVAARNAAARTGGEMALVWLAGALAAGWVVRRVSAGRRLETVAAVTAIVSCVYVTAATAAGWTLSGGSPWRVDRSQLDLLRAAGATRAVLLDVTARRRLTRSEFAAGWQLSLPVMRNGRRFGSPLAVLDGVPAGEYRLTVSPGGGDGWVMAGIAHDQFAIATEPLQAAASGLRLWLPVDVRLLIVRGDEGTQRQADRVTLQPIRLVSPSARVSGETARRAARYGATAVFFLDDRAFPEPGAFWVGGGRETSFVVAPDHAAAVTLALRNGPEANEITTWIGGQRQTLAMAPDESRTVDVAVPPSRGATLVRIAASGGFRPSDVDSANRDDRYLGVYVQVR